jgi:hypothetical protein
VSDEFLRKLERARAGGDLAAHNAIKAYRERRGMPGEVPPELDTYGFGQSFGACGISRTECKEDIRPGLDPKFANLAPFDERDVKRVIASAEGERDGVSWLALMELWDGRFAYLEGWCDYTGFD